MLSQTLSHNSSRTRALSLPTSFLQRGFSKAAKYEKMKHLQHSREADGYVIMDVEATGLDYKNDIQRKKCRHRSQLIILQIIQFPMRNAQDVPDFPDYHCLPITLCKPLQKIHTALHIIPNH